jgi:hypothetical protein
MQCEDYQGSCLSEKQVTKINKAEQQTQRKKSNNKNKQNGDPSDFLSNFAYGADVAGVVLADMEMIIVDAGFIDYAVSFYSPLGGAENGAGLMALAATAIADYQSGTTYLKSDRNRITLGVGQDTTVSLGNFVAGMVPEANYDAWISNKQLEYDNRRRSGELPATTMFEINIPRITVPPPFH